MQLKTSTLKRDSPARTTHEYKLAESAETDSSHDCTFERSTVTLGAPVKFTYLKAVVTLDWVNPDISLPLVATNSPFQSDNVDVVSRHNPASQAGRFIKRVQGSLRK